MLNLKKILKPYTETGALNEQVNLYGFVDPHAFLTKSGDVGVILAGSRGRLRCLDGNALDTLTKRLESALRLFDENFRVYQYLFKRNQEAIPYKSIRTPSSIRRSKIAFAYFASKADKLYSLQIYYVVLFEGSRYKQALLKSLTEFHKNPKKAIEDLGAAFSSRKQVVLLDRELTKALSTLHQKVKSFILQVSDFVHVELLGKQEAFRVLKRTLNFTPLKLQCAHLKHDTFLDYYLCESHLECHRGHLRARRLLRKGSDTQGTLGPELSAHSEEPSRSSGQLPHRYRVEEGRFGQDTESHPIQAPAFPQHQAIACEPPQRFGCSANGCFG